MVVPRLVGLTRIVRGVCKVELTPGESAVESRPWHLMSAVGTQKKPPIDFETTSRWRSLAVTTFPAIPGSHSRLAVSRLRLSPRFTIDILDYITGIGNGARDPHNTHTL